MDCCFFIRTDVEKALRRLDPQEHLERERRIKRAFDLSAKKKYLPEGKILTICIYIRVCMCVCLVTLKFE